MTNLLEVDSIRETISAASLQYLDSLEVFAEVDSTNTYLLNKAAPSPGRFNVALAEYQTAGRGRLNKRWESPPTSGLCLSIAYTFKGRERNLPCVTLAVGVGIARLLEEIGVRDVRLKWPNDLIVRDGKLGGILTEVQRGHSEHPSIVVGIGLNIDFDGPDGPAPIGSRIGRAIDLVSCADQVPSRSALSAMLIERLFETLAEFASSGFERYFDAWPRFDWLRGQQVSVESPIETTSGTCEGIDVDGALLVQSAGARQRVVSGSVYLDGQKGCSD